MSNIDTVYELWKDSPKPASADAYLDQIREGSFALKRVDIDTELSKRAQDRVKGTKEGLMQEIKNQNGLDVRLLDQVRLYSLALTGISRRRKVKSIG